ncbi:MAG TPA: hypothetical protein VML95_08855 [Longimicrobiales bacterium]|nr:hypothetical protein [Longimicrobiales bacterium]
MSPESTLSATVPLGIVSFFRKDPADRPALLLLKVDSPAAGAAAVDLAEALSRGGHRIVLCDLSLSAPELHRVLDVPNDEGMTDLFEFGASLRRVTTRVRAGGLFFAPAGVGVADPERLARHARWERLLSGAADAEATLLLYAPADLPGLPDIARRVPVAVVIGTSADADVVAAALPEGCALLDRVPLTEAEAVDDAPADAGAVAHEPDDGSFEERRFQPSYHLDDAYAAADDDRTAHDPDLAAFTPFDEDEVDPHPPHSADGGAAAASDSVLAARADSDGAVTEPIDAGAPEKTAEAPPSGETAEAPPSGDTADASAQVRTGLWIGLGILVALLLVLFWALMPEAGAAPSGEDEAAEAPALAGDAIPAVPERGEIAPLGYTVAIEAHQDLGTASQRLARLRRAEEGMPFLITPFLLDGVVFYRVMAGPYADSAEAVIVRDVLYRDGRKATVGDWDVRPTAYGFLIDEVETRDAARERTEELLDAGIPAYAVPVAADGATRVYAGAFELREQAPVLAGPLKNAGLDPSLVRVAGWVASP